MAPATRGRSLPPHVYELNRQLMRRHGRRRLWHHLRIAAGVLFALFFLAFWRYAVDPSVADPVVEAARLVGGIAVFGLIFGGVPALAITLLLRRFGPL